MSAVERLNPTPKNPVSAIERLNPYHGFSVPGIPGIVSFVKVDLTVSCKM